jgi:hypothetical protein
MRLVDCRIVRQVAERYPQGKGRRGTPFNISMDDIGTACDKEISRMNNVSIEGSGGKT